MRVEQGERDERRSKEESMREKKAINVQKSEIVEPIRQYQTRMTPPQEVQK